VDTASHSASPQAVHTGRAPRRSWADRFMSRPFHVCGLRFADYAPAIRLGLQRFRDDTLFDDVRCRLADEWDSVRGCSRLTWLEAQHAAHAAWERAASRCR
jgi:hypothetical protein